MELIKIKNSKEKDNLLSKKGNKKINYRDFKTKKKQKLEEYFQKLTNIFHFKKKKLILFFLFIILQHYFIYINNNEFYFYDKLENNNKTIIMIFAGRKKYLSNLMIYLKYLLNKNKIDEIHFWQFTNNTEDKNYLESISNIHKSSSKYVEYREIFPKIYNESKFIIGIKSTKGGAYLLLNDKYEIIFNLNNSKYAIFTNKITNEIIKTKGSKIPKDKFLLYTIEIKNFILLIKEKNRILFKYIIDDNNLVSIKVHSEKNSENYWYYKENKNLNIKLFDTEYRTNGNDWYEAYKYYLTCEFQILIKIDDDIVYMDLNRFDEYINFIRINKNINVIIPNLINHAVSVFYNNKYGLLPTTILNNTYTNKKSSLDIFDYYKDGQQAEIIHKYFINNIHKFINNNIEPINLSGQKPSICMFGIKKENFNNAYNSIIIGRLYKNRNENNHIINFEDEKYTYKLKNNYFYPKFVCVHYQFGPQIISGLTEKSFNDYKKLITINVSISQLIEN